MASNPDNSVQWLAQQIVADGHFAEATVKFWWPAIMGSEVTEPPEDEGDADFEGLLLAANAQGVEVSRLANGFRRGFRGRAAYNLKDLLVEIVLSKWFRADAVEDTDPVRLVALRDAGARRLLTPEELADKTAAITGVQWDRTKPAFCYPRCERRRNALTGGYRLLYGGIDSDGITERTRDITSVMVGVAKRHAAIVSCPAVNAQSGKDHWPIGSYIVMEKSQPWTGRALGETDGLHFAQRVNPRTLGRDDRGGTIIYPKHVTRRCVGTLASRTRRVRSASRSTTPRTSRSSVERETRRPDAKAGTPCPESRWRPATEKQRLTESPPCCAKDVLRPCRNRTNKPSDDPYRLISRWIQPLPSGSFLIGQDSRWRRDPQSTNIRLDSSGTYHSRHRREGRLMRAAPKALLLALSLLLATPAASVTEGDIAPEFELPVLGGETTRTLSASHGKVRYIDFWASWCPPCRVSVPEIVSLHQELGGSRFKEAARGGTKTAGAGCGCN